jgi:hypothetical protein
LYQRRISGNFSTGSALRDEGEQVVSIGWGDPNGSKTIEHKANPEDSNKD